MELRYPYFYSHILLYFVVLGSKILTSPCLRRVVPTVTYHSVSTPTNSNTVADQVTEPTQLVPYRSQSTGTQKAGSPEKAEPYSPFQTPSNKAEYALARADDLINWARKVCLPIANS